MTVGQSITFWDSRQWRMHCRLSYFVLVSSVAVVAAYGFGNRVWHNSAVIVVLASLILGNMSWNKIASILLPSICIFLISLVYDSVLQCTSLLGLLLFIANQKNCAASLLLAHLLPAVCFFIPSFISVYMLSPLVSVAFFSASVIFLHSVHDALRRGVIFAISVIYGCALIVFAFMRFQVDKCQNDGMPVGYNTGNTVETIIGKSLPQNGQIYYANQGLVSVTNSGTVYLDHDSCTSYDGGNFIQKSPWKSNSLIAAEPFRVNMAEDGCFVMNLGSKIASGWTRPIWGMCDSVMYSMLCAYDGKRLIFGDADMAGDMLAPYQEHLWHHIFGTDFAYRVWLIVSGSVLLTYVLLERFVMITSFFALILSLLLHVSLLLPPHAGGVRYVGFNLGYPHTSLCYGLVRAMHKSGINVLFTNRNARILAIGAGHTATRQAEQIVIMEPGAKVVIDQKVYTAGCVPMGNVKEVVDAREIFEECGRMLGIAHIDIDGVKIIATGAPSLLDSSFWE